MSNETEAAPAGANSPVKPSASRPLRVWPAVFLVVLMIIVRFVPAYLEGGLAKYWMVAMMGPMGCCLLLLIWWLAASQATWKERVFGFLGLIAVFALTMVLVEPLMRGGGRIPKLRSVRTPQRLALRALPMQPARRSLRRLTNRNASGSLTRRSGRNRVRGKG
jgi:hypothetical protein